MTHMAELNPGDSWIIQESALVNFTFYGTPLEGVRIMFSAIITIFLDELSQLQFILIPAVYTCGSLDI